MGVGPTRYNHRMMTTRFKVCCIASVEEAGVAVRYGASALGLVSEMPSGPGQIAEKLIGEIVRTIPPGVASFLLTSKRRASDIVDQQRRTGVNAIQICDRIVEGRYSDLRQALPGVSLVQVVHVENERSVEEARGFEGQVDAILLDSGSKTGKVKALGGTGRAHDWEISRRIRESVKAPVILAGGLNPSNVADAVRHVSPFAVDVCSGLRTNGSLDEKKLAEFALALRG